jgi:hypothetical protein
MARAQSSRRAVRQSGLRRVEYRYMKDGLGRYVPIVYLQAWTGNRWLYLQTYVDSGASWSVFHVDVAQLVDRKGLADRFDTAQGLEQSAQPVFEDAEDLQVEVGGTVIQQAVADEPAHAQRAPARLANGEGDPAGVVTEAHLHRIADGRLRRRQLVR